MSDMLKELTPAEKVAELDYAALNLSPEEIAETYSRIGCVEYSARALGIACRFRGVECVRALVEGGASFETPFTNYMIQTYGSYGDDLAVMLLDNFPDSRVTYFVVTHQIYGSVKKADGTELLPLPFEERAETARYLCENGQSAAFDAGELLFYSIAVGDERMTAVLKEQGAEFSEYRRRLLTEKGKPKDLCVWTCLLERLSAEKFAGVLTRLSGELGGEKLHCTSGIYAAISDKLYRPENLKCYLEIFDDPKLKKTDIMKSAIDNDAPECLAFAERDGWLSSPKKRDEMIQYAAERKSAECAAWLMDFKNRTADIAAERAKNEKKRERELNASPDSVSELKKIWSYKKRDDGTLIINGYKGNRTSITVPARIGKSAVMAIGYGAFSPFRNGVIVKNGALLKTITEVTLPDSITEIGERAFCDCYALRSVNIPNGVSVIGSCAFANTALEKIVLPHTLTYIGDRAFSNADKLTVIVPRGSYAEEYCKKYNIPCDLKGD
ncbi:MAG: leucine-rich repeat domain-containing protein [Oscillospiraceae bacterium]|nr:leucine-rich repeat domain-containing protein [Oscillospiraceae bacterium]